MRPFYLLTQVTLKIEVFLLKSDGVVEEEHISVSEDVWDSIYVEVPREGTWDISEHEGNVICQGFGEDSGQSGQHIVGTKSNSWDSAIRNDENGGDRVDVLLDFDSNILFVEFVMLNTATVG